MGHQRLHSHLRWLPPAGGPNGRPDRPPPRLRDRSGRLRRLVPRGRTRHHRLRTHPVPRHSGSGRRDALGSSAYPADRDVRTRTPAQHRPRYLGWTRRPRRHHGRRPRWRTRGQPQLALGVPRQRPVRHPRDRGVLLHPPREPCNPRRRRSHLRRRGSPAQYLGPPGDHAGLHSGTTSRLGFARGNRAPGRRRGPSRRIRHRRVAFEVPANPSAPVSHPEPDLRGHHPRPQLGGIPVDVLPDGDLPAGCPRPVGAERRPRVPADGDRRDRWRPTCVATGHDPGHAPGADRLRHPQRRRPASPVAGGSHRRLRHRPAARLHHLRNWHHRDRCRRAGWCNLQGGERRRGRGIRNPQRRLPGRRSARARSYHDADHDAHHRCPEVGHRPGERRSGGATNTGS